MCDHLKPWLTRFRIIRPMEAFPRLEQISVETRGDVSYCLRGLDRASERHCIFKITLAGAGRFADAAGEHVVPVGKGFLCEICDPATAYYYPPGAAEPWTFIYAAFSGRFAVEMVREMTRRFGPIFEVDPDGDLVRRLLAYADHDGRDVAISAGASGRFVTDLLTDLAASAEPAPELDRAGLLVRRAMDLVNRHLGANLNAGELADMLDVSREHLARTFTRQTGRSPYQYILRRKMGHACRLLVEGDLPVKQIAAAVGFADPAHFSRAFRAIVGQAPQAFRARGIMPADL